MVVAENAEAVIESSTERQNRRGDDVVVFYRMHGMNTKSSISWDVSQCPYNGSTRCCIASSLKVHRTRQCV